MKSIDNALLEKAEKIKIKADDLKTQNIYAYGVGHVLNDLTATCWFSFLLYYLTDIINLDKTKAGLVMLSGQIFDGLATPLVGILSDKYNTRCGKRTPWYLGGTVCIIICFSLIFQKCTICKSSSNPELWELVYYITLPSLFNVGWAAVQVSHMSLLPSISINKRNRDFMVRLRVAFSFFSQMLCLILSFIIFYYVTDKYLQYSVLSLMCICIGSMTSLYFYLYCSEIELSKNIPKYYENMKIIINKVESSNYDTIPEESFNKPQESFGIKYWLKKPAFYKYIVIYMLVRISINVTTSMLPYYLESILGIKKTSQGGTPVQISIMYLFITSGCLFNSFYIQKLLDKYNTRIASMIFSLLFTFFGLFPILFINLQYIYILYILCFIFGIGFAIGLTTASNLINDVVGSKGDHAAFVYGAYSLTDKFSCGIILYFFVAYIKDDSNILKYIIPILPIFCILLSLIIVGIKKKKDKSGIDNNLNNSKSLIDDSRFSFY